MITRGWPVHSSPLTDTSRAMRNACMLIELWVNASTRFSSEMLQHRRFGLQRCVFPNLPVYGFRRVRGDPGPELPLTDEEARISTYSNSIRVMTLSGVQPRCVWQNQVTHAAGTCSSGCSANPSRLISALPYLGSSSIRRNGSKRTSVTRMTASSSWFSRLTPRVLTHARNCVPGFRSFHML